MSQELQVNDKGDFVIASSTENLKIKVLGYEAKPITDEEADSIKEKISLHGKENLRYNNEQIVLKKKTKEKSSGN